MASDRIMPRQRRPGRGKQRNYTHNSRYLTSNKDAAAEQWGPSGSHASVEEPNNQNLRDALLTNHDPTTHDLRKGRLSPLEEPEAQAQELNNEYVLVYIHKVQPTDTLAGVLLAYDIEPTALRRANRLWPNDSIQMRSRLYLPVSDCAVKGVPLPSHGVSDGRPKHKESWTGDGSSQDRSDPPLKGPHHTPTSNSQFSEGHHSFVYIDPLGPVEIVRLSRPKLSHFPSPSGDRPLTGHRVQDRIPTTAQPQYKNTSHDISTDTFERLEVVGAAIETFVRRVAASARTNWVNKTTSDLIELTSQIGRRPQLSEVKGAQSSNGRNTNPYRHAEDTMASSATTNSATLHRDGSEASRSRRRTKRTDASEG